MVRIRNEWTLERTVKSQVEVNRIKAEEEPLIANCFLPPDRSLVEWKFRL